MILDTSFIIDLLKDKTSDEKIEELNESGSVKTTPVTAMELWEGLQKAGSTEREEQKVRKLLEELEHLDFEKEDGVKAAEINHRLEKKGEPIELEDVIIGSIASNRDEKVVTSNSKHFQRIEEIKVEET